MNAAPAMLAARAKEKKRQNAGRRFQPCESHGHGGQRLVEPSRSNRRALMARRRARITARAEARRACRGNPRHTICAEERTEATGGSHRWRVCQCTGDPSARRTDARDSCSEDGCAELGAAQKCTAPPEIPGGQTGVGACKGPAPVVFRRTAVDEAGARRPRRARRRSSDGHDGGRSAWAEARRQRIARLRAPAPSP